MVLPLVGGVSGSLIALLNYLDGRDATLLQQHVGPVFAEFEHIHANYIASFRAYIGQIENAAGENWIRPLQETLRRDNLFSAHEREKIKILSQATDHKVLGPFISSICNYLMNARLVDPLGKELYPNEVQRWRQGFSRTLGHIAEGNWQLVIDPNGAMPPLSPEEITQELKLFREMYTLDPKISEQDALKHCAALWALDAVVNDMQNQYACVSEAYAELIRKLL
jgi:hypothetical protein